MGLKFHLRANIKLNAFWINKTKNISPSIYTDATSVDICTRICGVYVVVASHLPIFFQDNLIIKPILWLLQSTIWTCTELIWIEIDVCSPANTDDDEKHPFSFLPWNFICNAFYLIAFNFYLCQFMDVIDVVFGPCVWLFFCRCRHWRLYCVNFSLNVSSCLSCIGEKKTGWCYRLPAPIFFFIFSCVYNIRTCEFHECNLLSMPIIWSNNKKKILFKAMSSTFIPKYFSVCFFFLSKTHPNLYLGTLNWTFLMKLIRIQEYCRIHFQANPFILSNR